jgi:hypothetical protein
MLRSRQTRFVGTALTALVAALGATAPAIGTAGPATPRSSAVGRVEAIDTARLAMGPPPSVPYLLGRTIHAGHRRIPVRVPAREAGHLQLLGLTPKGWAVVGGSERLLLVTPQRTARVFRVAEWGPFTNAWYLSRDHQRIVTAVEEDQAGTDIQVWHLDGRKGPATFSENDAYPSDIDGRRTVLQEDGATRLWAWGHKPRKIAGSSQLARLDQDLLFSGGYQRSGPTSLSHPGTPSWKTTFAPIAISPDGRAVLTERPGGGSGYGFPGVVALGLEHGRTLGSWEMPGLSEYRVVAWETDHTVLLGVQTRLGQTLVRCRLGGGCERTLPWTPRVPDTGVPITVPFMEAGGAYY